MIVTETEAKEKWCPFARVGIHAANRSYDDVDEELPSAWFRPTEPSNEGNPNEAHCIGSRCMMWRWVPSDPKELPHRYSFNEAGKPERIENDPTRGYCGLGQSYGVARPPSR
jgi:hypothetical protein